jgi:hypothetical protein
MKKGAFTKIKDRKEGGKGPAYENEDYDQNIFGFYEWKKKSSLLQLIVRELINFLKEKEMNYTLYKTFTAGFLEQFVRAILVTS